MGKRIKVGEQVNNRFRCPDGCQLKEECKHSKESNLNDFKALVCEKHTITLAYKRIK